MKATWFMPTGGAGSHNVTFGMDAFNDQRFANNHQSGSDYRIYNTGTIIRGAGDSRRRLSGVTRRWLDLHPVEPDSAVQRRRELPDLFGFVNDSWRINGRLTANLGLRWDKNHGVDEQGILVAKDSACSPRFGIVLDPAGDQKWSITASFAQYVAALNNALGDSASAGGQSPDVPLYLSRPEHQRRPDGRDTGVLRRRHPPDLRLVHSPTAARTCRCGASPIFPA